MDNHESLIGIVLDALMTDGAHHKQYFLVKILYALTGSAGVQRIKERLEDKGYEWTDGVAP